ncbi:hypothetical protein Tsubulata_009672, partial [Turnera subulata]
KLQQVVAFPVLIKRELVCIISFLTILLSTFFIFDLLGPLDPQSLFRFGFLAQILPNTHTHTQPPPSSSSSSSSSSSQGDYCDYSHGRWVRDETYKNQSYTEDCPFLDPGFRCVNTCGRKDVEYQNWRWQPKSCDMPRFNATELLERSRNGRIVFAGDSIGRNQWESFLCMLSQGVTNKSTIYEEHGNPISKHKGFLSLRFGEYNLTVEYYRVPFLVYNGRPPPNSSTAIRTTVKVDQLHWFSKLWQGADVLVFNGGHWWNEDKTVKAGCYFEVGGRVNISMNVMEAFERSLQTWKSWVTQNLNPARSHSSLIYFKLQNNCRNGTWNEGGRCDVDTEPEKNYAMLEPEPGANRFISKVIKQMDHGKWKVQYLDITYLSQFRYDGHPSRYREPGTPPLAPQDCSHWCLPGVPDWSPVPSFSQAASVAPTFLVHMWK